MNLDIKKLAVEANNTVWKLLQAPHQTPIETSNLISAAYASLYLWNQIGTDLHRARGHWLLSRSFVVIGNVQLAQVHADLCAEFTQKAEAAKDFDHAYVIEAQARVLALSGQKDKARPLFEKAKELGSKIADPEDKSIYEGDLNSEPWFGLNG